MKAISLVAIALAAAFRSDAQIATGVQRLTDGATQVTIKNNSPVPLTALVLTANLVARDDDRNVTGTRNPVLLYQDVVVDADAAPLMPNEERTLPPFLLICAPMSSSLGPLLRKEMQTRAIKPPATGGLCQMEQLAVAGVFADGSSTGDKALLTRLMLRRSNMLLALDTTIEILRDAGSRNIPRSQMIRQFRLMADSLNRSYLPTEQQIGRSLYQAMMTKLTSLPEGPLGSPFPPSDFVSKEMAALNQRRVSLSEAQPSLAYPTFPSEPAHRRLP